MSAIDKQPVDELSVTPERCVGDETNHKSHGGPARVVHVFPSEGYARLRQILGRDDVGAPGVGENLSTQGLREADVCVGDVLAVGGTRLRVTQPRMPCWLLNMRFGDDSVAAALESEGITGFFTGVEQPGAIRPGDAIEVVERPCPLLTLPAVQGMFGPTRTASRDVLEAIAGCEHVAEPWKTAAAKRLEGDLEWPKWPYKETPKSLGPPPTPAPAEDGGGLRARALLGAVLAVSVGVLLARL